MSRAAVRLTRLSGLGVGANIVKSLNIFGDACRLIILVKDVLAIWSKFRITLLKEVRKLSSSIRSDHIVCCKLKQKFASLSPRKISGEGINHPIKDFSVGQGGSYKVVEMLGSDRTIKPNLSSTWSAKNLPTRSY